MGTTVTAVLDQDKALAASEALVERLKVDASNLLTNLDQVVTEGLHSPVASVDAQATARDLAWTLGALEEIHWPHELVQRNQLRYLREAAGLTIEQLAEQADQDRMDLHRWELGHEIPRGEADRLARCFKVSPAFLLGEESA